MDYYSWLSCISKQVKEIFSILTFQIKTLKTKLLGHFVQLLFMQKKNLDWESIDEYVE